MKFLAVVTPQSIYQYEYYISEPEARSRADGYFFLGPKFNILIQEMYPKNGPVHVEFRIMRYAMALATEAELGGLFEKCQKATSTQTSLAEMGHSQPPTPVETDKTEANIIVYGTSKKNIQRNIHEILLGQRQNTIK